MREDERKKEMVWKRERQSHEKWKKKTEERENVWEGAECKNVV